MSCKKDLTDSTDISLYKWELNAIITENETYSKKDLNFNIKDAYIIKFESDSTFTLNTSINLAAGKYKIPKNGEIIIHGYQELTEVAAIDYDDKKLNENLIEVFSKVLTYEVRAKKLIFNGEKGKVEFEKY